MKKPILVIVISFLFLSCSIPRYLLKNSEQTTGVDFSRGKWLLNFIEATSGTQNKLNILALKDFSKILKERLVYIPNAKGLLLPKKIEINPSKLVLSNLKKGTDFDYFINIKASYVKSQLGIIDFTPHKYNKGGMNESEVILEIYDLNTSEIIYSQCVVGFVTQVSDSDDVHFSKSNDDLILGAYKKLIDDIEKKSIFN